MSFAPVFRAEWLKILTLRTLTGTLAVAIAVAAVFGVFGGLDAADGGEPDALFMTMFGVMLGQIAAIAFGSMAVAAEFRGGALQMSLVAVPRRGRWFAAKILAVGAATLPAGLLTGAASLLASRAVMGDAATGLSTGRQIRGVVGCGIYLTLMALLAAGLAALLRSGTATLSILIPFILIVSFVVGDVAGAVTDFFPDKAGQVVLHQTWDGHLGPWSGLAVTALWAAAALLAGAWSIRRRDA